MRIVEEIERVVEEFNKDFKERYKVLLLPHFATVQIKRFVSKAIFNELIKRVEKLDYKYYGIESVGGRIEVNFVQTEYHIGK